MAADYLADLSELPYLEVKKMLEDYQKVHQSWLDKTEAQVTHLSKEEVSYLINLFGQTPK